MFRARIVILGFVLAGLGGLGTCFLPVFQTAGGSSTPISGSLPNLNPIQPPTEPFTVLLLGSDDDSKLVPDRLNTQSMILLRVDPSTKQATILSIPRDPWVPIPNHGMGKICGGYQFGGAAGAVAAVESNFKVHIDDCVGIGLDRLVEVIDMLGGVNLRPGFRSGDHRRRGLTPTRRRPGSAGSTTVESKNRPKVVVVQWLGARFGSKRPTMRFRTKSDAPDLHSQLESLLDQVWRSESDWRLWDRLDAAVTLETLREMRLKRRGELDRAA